MAYDEKANLFGPNGYSGQCAIAANVFHWGMSEGPDIARKRNWDRINWKPKGDTQ